ncbi:MAG: hypothetical protein NTX25_09460 [Proteobacteria bacterium]|nr:hypothetical protein [Pseudomonadota bacterium]
MKHLILLPFILLAACRSTKGASEAGPIKPLSSSETKPQILLQKIVGRLPVDAGKAQIFDCNVLSSDVPELAKVQAWIKDLERAPMQEAYLFRAADPSIEVYAFLDGKKILVFEYASVRKYPKPDDASQTKNLAADELIKLANEKCPSPK